MGIASLAGCAAFERPHVNTVFVSPDVYRVSVTGHEQSTPPALRQAFLLHAADYAAASGCASYRIIREQFSSAERFNSALIAQPSAVFGNRPTYSGFVQCTLVPPLATARPAG